MDEHSYVIKLIREQTKRGGLLEGEAFAAPAQGDGKVKINP
jgi:hypothetical protein